MFFTRQRRCTMNCKMRINVPWDLSHGSGGIASLQLGASHGPRGECGFVTHLGAEKGETKIVTQTTCAIVKLSRRLYI